MSVSTVFISHGGGPLPLLGDPRHQGLVNNIQEASKLIERPDAIVIVSAHWEESKFKITAAAEPELIYDYYGFPEESYHIKYPAKGSPALAEEIYQLLQKHDLPTELDKKRGLDHGVFVPLKIMYPETDIPCLQVSINSNLSPEQHIKLGEALSELETQNVLVMGSGFSFHNMKAFFSPAVGNSKSLNVQFDKWLNEICLNKSKVSEQEIENSLINWYQAPGARFAHPREEHLIPLHVCYGIKKAAAKKSLQCNVFGYDTSSFLW